MVPLTFKKLLNNFIEETDQFLWFSNILINSEQSVSNNTYVFVVVKTIYGCWSLGNKTLHKKKKLKKKYDIVNQYIFKILIAILIILDLIYVL